MKLQLIDNKTRKPITNYKFQLQIKGKDSGYLSVTTDNNGYFQLDEKYSGQQIMSSSAGLQGQWSPAKEGQQYYVNYLSTTAGGKQKQPSMSSQK